MPEIEGMSFCISAGESPETALPRLLCERTRRARSGMQGVLDDPAIHRVRRELKRVRAVLELVRAGTRRKDLRRWRRELEHCSGELADARDARARLQSLSLLPPPARSGISARSWNALTRHLRKALETHTRALNRGRQSRAVRRRLGELLGEFRSIGPSIHGWKAFTAAIRDAYRHSRSALKRLAEDPSARRRHRWRVRVKRLSYALALIRPAESPALAGWASGLELLAERLGEEHDLLLLRKFICGRPGRWMPRAQRDRCLRVLGHRRRELAAAALRLGGRLFLLPSSGFAAAVERHCRAQGFRSASGLHDLASDSWSGRGPLTVAPPADLPQANGGGLLPDGSPENVRGLTELRDGLRHPRSRGARRRRR